MASNPGLNVDWYPRELPSGTRVHMQTCVTADGNAAKGTLYQPALADPRQSAVVALMHPRVDFSRHYLIPPLLAAGHAVWAQQARDAGSDLRLVHEQTLLDLAAGLDWLRGLGFARVVGLGNSGGAGLLTYYVQQSLRQASGRVTRTPAGRPTGLDKAALPGLDAVAYLAPHPGQGRLLANCIDPSVADENDAFSAEQSLDPFDESNGYRPAPASASYSQDFVHRYRTAQLARVRRIDERARRAVDETMHARKRVKSGECAPDDIRRAGSARLMTVWRTDADLRAMDLSLDPSDRSYGSVFGPRPDRTNYGIAGFGRVMTPDAWLSTWSATTSLASFERAGPEMTLPALLIRYTGDNCVFPSDFAGIVRQLGSADKRVEHVAADHYGNALEDRGPGGRGAVAEIIDDWLRGLA